MRILTTLLLSLMLASAPAMADAPPGEQTAHRHAGMSSGWWIWTLVAVLSAGTVVTSVVVATMPRGSLNRGPAVDSGTMGLTVRF
jgi:hypothetical protein